MYITNEKEKKSMNIEEKKFRLVGLQPLLGGVALDKEIFSKYIATKARDFEKESAKKRC